MYPLVIVNRQSCNIKIANLVTIEMDTANLVRIVLATTAILVSDLNNNINNVPHPKNILNVKDMMNGTIFLLPNSKFFKRWSRAFSFKYYLQ